MKRRKWTRYPSIGGLDAQGLIAVVHREGMEVVAAFKTGFCCWYSIVLYGTSMQMKKVEAEWNEAGNKTDNRKPKGAWAIRGDVPEEQWLDRRLAAVRARAISTKGGTKRVHLNHGAGDVLVPPGYRGLHSAELPQPGDIAWHGGANVWEPIDLKELESTGSQRFKEQCYGVLRSKRQVTS